MVRRGTCICPKCGGTLRLFDKVNRIVRTKGRKTKKLSLKRLRCKKCHAVHRMLPPAILPYKQYEAEIVRGVIEGLITCETIGYEDYPCEATMIRWRSALALHATTQKKQPL